jgi:hypothetical protein
MPDLKIMRKGSRGTLWKQGKVQTIDSRFPADHGEYGIEFSDYPDSNLNVHRVLMLD